MVHKKGIYCLLWFSIFVLTLYPQSTYSQLNQFGYPFIRNYSLKENQVPGTNLAVAMNSKGVMYFANDSKGVVEYDGVSWKVIEIEHHSNSRSLAIDTNDIVFVGSVGEMGYIAPDKLGNSVYHSVTHLIDTSKIHFTSIWKTYATSRGVFFCSNSHIFHFQFPNQIKVIELPKEAFFSFYLDEKLINGFYKAGLLEYKENKMETMPGVEPLINQDILQILPFSTNEWLVFTYNGLFIYNTVTKKIDLLKDKGFDDKINSVLIKSTVYNGCVLPDFGFAIATKDNGIFLCDKKLKLYSNFKTETGLQNSTISDLLYNSNQGVLWAALGNGISRIEYNSPFRVFGKESNLNGTILSTIRYNETLYVGTFTGLSYLTFDSSGIPWFKEINGLKGESVYSLIIFPVKNGESKLIAGTSDDLYEIKGTEAIPFGEIGITAYVISISKKIDNTFYVGCSKGIRRVNWVNGKWNVTFIPNSGNEIYSIFEDKIGNIWASTAIDGLMKISKKNDIAVYSTKEGLPTNLGLYAYFYEKENKVVVGSRYGIYQFNPANDNFEPSSLFQLPGNPKDLNIINIYNGYSGSIWINKNNRLLKLIPDGKNVLIDSVTFKRFPDLSDESIYNESNGITWISSPEGLISYNNLFKDTTSKPFYALIRSVTSNDSLIFGGNFNKYRIIGSDTLTIPSGEQTDELKPVLKYRNNNLTFTFSSPYFQDESANQFSYILEGYNDTWSKWSKLDRAVYTNLGEGSYTFRAKAMNIYGQISEEADYSLDILPPWYRTIWAIIGYFIAAILVIVISVKIYTRKLEEDKKRLEGIVKERTAEVVSQKIEIEHKNKEITDSIHYAKRIQEALLPVKNQIEVPNLELFVFFRPKDIVSGDFYFIRQIPTSNTLIATAADCTGHGVPGAFMSMLGISFLNELIAKQEILHSDEILNLLRLQVIASLNPKGLHFETKDGMDISLIVYNYKTNLLEFSGANNPLYHFRKGELNEVKADKMPVGLHERCKEPFHRQEITPEPGDIVYLFSDGFIDQFGGEHGKKYLSKNFKEFLLGIHQKPMQEQEQLIAAESTNWRGHIDQIDDQVVMGIRFL